VFGVVGMLSSNGFRNVVMKSVNYMLLETGLDIPTNLDNVGFSTRVGNLVNTLRKKRTRFVFGTSK
jgi:hypothetical protein